MTKKSRLSLLLLVVALFLPVEPGWVAVPAFAQSKTSSTVEANDPDFAEFVKKATTKPEFLSPLVDHLPKKAGVPTPKDVLGYHIGTEKKLTYAADQQTLLPRARKGAARPRQDGGHRQDRRGPRRSWSSTSRRKRT